jgi:hypothetical protein
MAELNQWTMVRARPWATSEREERFQDLVKSIQRQGEEVPKLARWYVRRLGVVFDVPLTLGDNNPVEHLRILAGEIFRALEVAGAVPSRRIEAAGVAVELVQVLGEVMAGWRDEAAGAPNSAVSPPTPP